MALLQKMSHFGVASRNIRLSFIIRHDPVHSNGQGREQVASLEETMSIFEASIQPSSANNSFGI